MTGAASDAGQRFEHLARLAQTVSTSPELTAILDSVAEAALAVLPGSSTRVWVAEDHRLVLRSAAGRRFSPAAVPEQEFAFGEGLTGLVAQTRECVVVEDVRRDPRVATPWFEPEGFVSFIGIPLLVKDALVGVLSLITRHPHVFSLHEIEVLGAFAAQAAIAIDNARTSTALATRVQRLRALARVNRLVSASLDPTDVLQEITDAGTKLLEATAVGFWIADDRRRELKLVAFSGEAYADFSGAPFPYDQLFSGWVARHREALNIADVTVDDRLVAPEWWERHDMRAYYGVPVMLDGTLLAVLSFVGRRAFRPDEDQDLLDSFTAQAAIAIRNARLFASSERRRRAAEALVAVGRDLARAMEPTEIGRVIANAVHRLLATKTAGLYLLDGASKDLVLLAGAEAGQPVIHTMPRGTGLTGVALREQRAVATSDVLSDVRVVLKAETRAQFEQSQVRATLAVPMVLQRQVLGALVIGDHAGRSFTDEEVELVQTFADRAALALDNARLLHESRTREARLAALLETTRQLAGLQPLESLLSTITEGCANLLASNSVGLRLVEGDELVNVTRWGEAPEQLFPRRVPIRNSLAGRVLTAGHPLIIRDLLAEPALTDAQREESRRLGHRAWLGVPVRVGHRVLGVLSARTRDEHGFSDIDVATATAFASQAAVALENAQLFTRQNESQQLLQSTLDALGAHIAVLDESGTIIAVNEAWRRLVEPSQLPARECGVGMNYLAACEGASGEGAAEAHRLAGALREVIGHVSDAAELEYSCPTPDGARWFLARVTRFGPTTPARVVVAHEDVTELKRTAAALQASEEQFRQAQKMEAIGRLAGGVAHDFNNLLTVITGRTQLLLRRLREADPIRRDLTLIQKTAERATALTRQLLAFSRKQVLQPKVVGLDAVVSGLAPMLQRLIGEDIELVIVPGAGDARVKADPNQLEQVIVNLVVNARDAMPRGGRLAVETTVIAIDETSASRHAGMQPGPHVALAVADSGVGMTEEVRARAFEPFFTTKPQGQGTGLGLSTVYGIVQQHQGGVEVDSAPGAGTTFVVYLPVTAELPDAGPAETAAGAPSGTETILLLEDEDEVRALVRDILRQSGYDVLEAASATEALALGHEHPGPIHLLLTDVVMPQMSGREFAERLAPLRAGIKILYMSGYTDDALGPRALLDPTIVVLQKPFNPDVLVRKVRDTLDRSLP